MSSSAKGSVLSDQTWLIEQRLVIAYWLHLSLIFKSSIIVYLLIILSLGMVEVYRSTTKIFQLPLTLINQFLDLKKTNLYQASEERPTLNATSEVYLVRYNITAGEEERIVVPTFDTPPEKIFTPGSKHFEENTSTNIEADQFGNFSDLQEVESPSQYPWRMNVKIHIQWSDSVRRECSGVLIDERHVLTASHCIYHHEKVNPGRCVPPAESCWATSAIVLPAYHRGNKPYGIARAVLFISNTEWMVTRNFDWDLALIFIDRPIGILTGYFGYGYNKDDSFYSKPPNIFHSVSYPQEPNPPYDGKAMLYWYGIYDEVLTDRLRIYKEGHKGMSGGGSFVLEGDSRVVYAVHSHSRVRESDRKATHTRITADKYQHISYQIDDDRPDTFDLIPLDVNVSPTDIREGEQFSSMDYLIHNYSDVIYNGMVTIHTYLSTDDEIDTSDTLIGSQSVHLNLNPRESVRVSVINPPSIPNIDSDGKYYIGVILMISDFDLDNNTTLNWDTAEIELSFCYVSFTPSTLLPSDVSSADIITPYF